MTYPSIKETFYRSSSDRSVILTVPHGAEADEFLRFFSEIEAHPELRKVWPIFETYLAIERDTGSTELAHAIAYELSLNYGIESQVIEMNYPRGILDGGRLRDHCLRSCLPTSLLGDLQESMLRIHDVSLAYIEDLYEKMRVRGNSVLVDIHTMASFCPIDEAGRRFTFPVSFARLEDYVEQYLNAKNHSYRRKIDLICSDPKGRKLADPRLLSALSHELSQQAYTIVENEPYHAAPNYLSYQHMHKVPAISLDIPKHLIALGSSEGLELDVMALDVRSIRRLAQTLARGVNAALSSSLDAS